MAVRCLFFAPGTDAPCQVLRTLGATPQEKRTQRQLEERYCNTGSFISCPIFSRVEQGLIEANRLRASCGIHKGLSPSANLPTSSPDPMSHKYEPSDNGAL